MRKIIIWFLLIAFCMITSLAMAEDPCDYTCLNQEFGKIQYCNTSECICGQFDFESQLRYCEPFSSPRGVIFRLCDCDRIDELSSEIEYSVSLQINTPGVYWSPINPSLPATPTSQSSVSITTYEDVDSVCQGSPGTVAILPISAFYNSTGALLDSYDPVPGGVNSCVPPIISQQATLLTTSPGLIFEPGHSTVLVDLPAMFYDNTVVSIYDEVSVTIDFKETSAICPNCVGICSCTSIIGTFGCIDSVCDYSLPYLTLNSSWWCGLALSNSSSVQNFISIKFHNGLGKEAIYTVLMEPYQVSSQVLSYYISAAIGDDLSSSVLLTAEISSTSPSQIIVILGDSLGSSGSYGYKNTCCCPNIR